MAGVSLFRQANAVPNNNGAVTGSSTEIELLKKRAAVEIFLHFDLPQIPNFYWVLLDALDRPADAFETYVRAASCDVDRVITRDPDTLSRLTDFTIALSRLTLDDPDLPSSVRIEADRLIRKKRFDALRQLGLASSNLLAAIRIIRPVAARTNWAALKTQEHNARNALSALRSDTPEDYSDWRNCAVDYDELATKLERGVLDYVGISDKVAAHWPEAWDTGSNREKFNKIEDRFDEVLETLEDDHHASVDDYRRALKSIYELTNEISELLRKVQDYLSKQHNSKDRSSTGSGRGSKRTAGTSSKSQRELALEVLEFQPGDSPTNEEIRVRYFKLIKLYHPDTGNPGSSHEKMVALNNARDVLL